MTAFKIPGLAIGCGALLLGAFLGLDLDLDTIVREWGYVALLIGTFLEGETIVVIAGMLARQDLLEVHWIILFSFLGTFASDQLFFHLGRSRGMAFLEKRPRWRQRTDKVLRLLHRHRIPVVLGFRFLYGVRNVTPFAIGCTGMSSRTFFILNFIGALVWATSFAVGGYVFGLAIEKFFGKTKFWLLGIVGIAVAAFVIHRLIARRVARRNNSEKGQEEIETPPSGP